MTCVSMNVDGLFQLLHRLAKGILAKYPDVKNHGFYLVSTTCVARDFQTITRNGPATGSFVVKQVGRSSNKTVWSCISSDNDPIPRECKEYKNNSVLFFQGYYFTYKQTLIRVGIFTARRMDYFADSLIASLKANCARGLRQRRNKDSL